MLYCSSIAMALLLCQYQLNCLEFVCSFYWSRGGGGSAWVEISDNVQMMF